MQTRMIVNKITNYYNILLSKSQEFSHTTTNTTPDEWCVVNCSHVTSHFNVFSYVGLMHLESDVSVVVIEGCH